MKKEYKLCYVDENKAYFTDNYDKQWGDDWNDKPYEDNAGEPYDFYFENRVEHKINLIVLYFDLLNRYWDYLPCYHGRFSVEQINKGAIAWIITDDFCVQAGTNIEEFKKIIKDNGGKIYIEDID